MNCSFCGNEIELGTEKIFVSKKGKAFYFCSSKCEKNLLKLKRKPRRVRWTAEYRKEKAIRLRGMEKPAEKKKKPEKPKEKTEKKHAEEKHKEKKHPKHKEKHAEEKHKEKHSKSEEKHTKKSKPKAEKSKKSKKDKK